ncbi:serine/threonine protein kinase [Hypoxylon trugodes]|uniref:serine/threonine protein kinase n=1 Tax=Hypoxylon trugodes TaxID=326681 RepID=UPI00219BD278|nr:serine/threonine protein kinase [Hypoxylon trugodes]KAI1389286.1 serine/threonine protein kinase [Hypoxylon trugodes]
MHPPTNSGDNGESQGEIAKLKINKPLNSFPTNIFNLADSLKHLDLSGTGLSALPEDFGCLWKLKIAFFSNCNFTVFPRQLASCPELEMVAFRSNSMVEVPEDTLPPKLRWLILTNNRIRSVPRSIGRCWRLQKCMLAGNQLQCLPDEMVACRKLALLRLSANRIRELPDWLFNLPELAFLSFAGNLCCSSPATSKDPRDTIPFSILPEASWEDLDIHNVLGEGASGIISKGSWNGIDQVQEVAIKLFKGDVTSDGTPADEMEACIRAGSHSNLINPLAKITGHPDGKEGLVMQLIPPRYHVLGLPPSLQTCTRDCFSREIRLTTRQGLEILYGIARAAGHLHKRGVAHGDLYAHNILYSGDEDEQEEEGGHALLGDFGAASIYTNSSLNYIYDDNDDNDDDSKNKFEWLEVLAFAHLLEDVWGITKPRFDEEELRVAMLLVALHRQCLNPTGSQRPSFNEISRQLSAMKQRLTSTTTQ